MRYLKRLARRYPMQTFLFFSMLGSLLGCKQQEP